MPLPLLAAAGAKKIILPLILLAIGTGLVLFFYFSGKSAGKNKQKVKDGQKIADYEKQIAGQVKLPNSGSGIPLGWTPDGLVALLHETMDGADLFFANDDKISAFDKLSSLTDDQITTVSNAFNLRFKKKDSDESLYQWIYNESGGDARVRALAALERLGLK
jgi:hypothetical protein